MNEAAGGVIVLGWQQLALATGFVVLAGALSIAMGLGVAKSLWIGAARTYVQLLVLGFVLRYVFNLDSALAVIGILLLMVFFSARIISRRATDGPPVLVETFLAMMVTGFLITFAVTGLVVKVDPWYMPRYVIPIAGMVLGNSMNGIALALERTFSDLDARSDEILALTALGATPWEAAQPSIRSALRAGMIPGINTLSAVGIVFIPGMMTGQVLAGVDPLVAAPYQIVVMLMIACADILGSMAAVLLTYRRRFTKDGIFLEKGFRTDVG